jgi:hypothetical protein
MNAAAHEHCVAAFIAGVAQCQPVTLRCLLRGLKARGFSAGQVRHAATRTVATGAVRVLSKRRPFLYALPEPGARIPSEPSLHLGPAALPLTQQVLHTLEGAGKDGATRAALSTLYAEREVSDAAIGCALIELHQRTHRVTRRGARGAYVYVFALADVPTPRALGFIDAVEAHAMPVALAPEWPAPTADGGPQGAPSTANAPAWRIAA